jgi:hypothetical protein
MNDKGKGTDLKYTRIKLSKEFGMNYLHKLGAVCTLVLYLICLFFSTALGY